MSCVRAGETLLSPLVMCGPHGLKFLKPVELRLPHCASMTPDGWSFALKSSDSSSGTLSSVLLGSGLAFVMTDSFESFPPGFHVSPHFFFIPVLFLSINITVGGPKD